MQVRIRPGFAGATGGVVKLFREKFFSVYRNDNGQPGSGYLPQEFRFTVLHGQDVVTCCRWETCITREL